MMPSPATMAPGWADQPAAPPAQPKRRLVTPAARAHLRAIAISLDDHPDAPQIIRLADARALAEIRRTPSASAAAAGPPANATTTSADPAAAGSWASLDVPIRSDVPTPLRLARAVVAAVAALGYPADNEVRALVHSLPGDGTETASALLANAGSLSVAGVERHLATSPAQASAADAVLEIIDGTHAGVTRVLSSRAGRIVIGIGAPTRRVMAHRADDGQELIAIISIVEIWVHGGGLLTTAHAALMAASVGRALGARDGA